MASVSVTDGIGPRRKGAEDGLAGFFLGGGWCCSGS